MYWHTFGLKRSPFSCEIEPGGLFHSEMLEEGLRRIRVLLRERGMAVVTGEPGAGKTTLVRAGLNPLAPSSHLPLYAAASQGRKPLLPVVEQFLALLGEPLPHNNAAKALHRLKDAMLSSYDKNRLPILVIDDAHFLDEGSLLLLKNLTNYQMDSRLPFCLFLVAPPSIRRTLDFSHMEEVRQRILFFFHIPGLKPHEVEGYLAARLAAAGCERPLFPQEIAREIHLYSGGLPRKINQIAGLCLLSAAAEKKSLIDRPCLNQALMELGMLSPEPGKKGPWPNEQEVEE